MNITYEKAAHENNEGGPFVGLGQLCKRTLDLRDMGIEETGIHAWSRINVHCLGYTSDPKYAIQYTIVGIKLFTFSNLIIS